MFLYVIYFSFYIFSLLGVIYKGSLDYFPTMYLLPVDIMLVISTITAFIAIFKSKVQIKNDL